MNPTNKKNEIILSFAGDDNHTKQHDNFDGEGSVLAHATMPPNKEICFDVSEKWNEDFFINVLIHELGHVLGLSHVSDEDSIMYPSYQIINKSVISPNDREMIMNRYTFLN